MPEDRRRELIADLLHAARVLAAYNCLPATDGNFSARVDDDHVLATASGIEKRELSANDLVKVVLSDDRPSKVSTEWGLHRAIYHNRPEIRCVLHVHAPALTSFAAAHQVPSVNLLAEAYMTIGEIALVPFVRPGTPEVGETLIQTNPRAMMYLLSNHGAVAVGATIRETLHRLERAEFLARVQLDTLLLGGPKPLTPEQLAALRRSQSK